MRELTGILRTWRADPEAGILATVVHVEGSAYRRPGARMLIGSGGRRTGTISGGCLEGDVARKAEWWTAGGPALRVYDTASDEDAAWEFGLGCNGVIDVLLERVNSAETRRLLQHLDSCQQRRQKEVVATVIRAKPGSAYRVGDHFCGIGEMPLGVRDPASESLSLGRSRLLRLADAEIFLEYVEPSQRLVIFGAGHDVVPVVSCAAQLGWEVTVVDAHAGFSRPERFPGAATTATLPPSCELTELRIDAFTAVVLMTHSFPLDLKLLPQLLAANPRYLGLLGPWKRTERLFSGLGIAARGANLHAPVGLDLGGDSPESIALAIVAEIQAFLHQRKGGSLRWRSDSIHRLAETIGEAAEPMAADQRAELSACEISHA